MIGQVLKRGGSVRGLLYYLFTEGQAGQKGLESAHTDARVIAGWDSADSLASLQPPVCAGGNRDFKALASALNQPVAALGLDGEELARLKPVYHLALSAAKDRRPDSWSTATSTTSSGPTSPGSTWTGWGWRAAGTTAACGGWRSGMPMTTCTS